MSTTAMTLATAPRELEPLTKIGRFNARMLAQEGGLFATEKSKTTFMQMNNEEQANELFNMLQRLDKKPAGKPAGASTRTPSNTGAKAGGRKAAEAQTEEPDETPEARTPANAGAVSAPSGEGAVKLLKSIQALEANYGSIVTVLENLGQQSQMQQSSINRGVSMTLLSVAVLLQIAEEVMQAPQSQILQAAFDDMPRLTADVAKYLPDETPEGTDEDPEDEAGNE